MISDETFKKIREYINENEFENAETLISQHYDDSAPQKIKSLFGIIKSYLAKYDEAVVLLESSLTEDASEEVYERLIVSCTNTKHHLKAYNYAKQFFEKFPNSETAISQVVTATMYIGKMLEAEQICAEALGKNPNSEILWIKMGILLELNYCNEEIAQKCYRKVLEINSNSLSAFNNLAISLTKTGEYKEAETLYKRILAECPNNNDIKKSLGMLYLKQRNFHSGYEFFTQRPSVGRAIGLNNFWDGKSACEVLSVVCDQGFGDHIQFARYLPYLADKSKKVNVYCYKGLTELFKHSFKSYEFLNFYDDNNIPKEFPTVLITNLSYYLGMDFDNIPFCDGYLNYDKSKYQNYKTKQFNNDKLKIGLCWEAGSTAIRELLNKTINIREFAPILQSDKSLFEFYSFQVNPASERYKAYKMIDLGAEFKDFDDTSSALKNLDLLITVDTATAHLAGALGVKTVMLIPYSSDWRWFDNTDKTEWYNSIQILKQTDRISWENEINKLIEIIKNL